MGDTPVEVGTGLARTVDGVVASLSMRGDSVGEVASLSGDGFGGMLVGVAGVVANVGASLVTSGVDGATFEG